jgi:hypothetical protein
MIEIANRHEAIEWLVDRGVKVSEASEFMDLVGFRKRREPAVKAAQHPSGFEQFWSVYPRKTGKLAAEKAYAKAIECLRATPEEILEVARRYAEERRGADPKFTPHPATWLNQGRWSDAPQAQFVEQRRSPIL